MTQLEKLKAVAKLVKDNLDDYKPSYHIYMFYYNSGVDDIASYVMKFKIAMGLVCDVIINSKQEDRDFSDINPEPLFYIDETSIEDCFDVMEVQTKLLISTAMLAQTMLKEEYEEGNEGNGYSD